MTKDEFKSLFLKLTEFTIPFKMENKLEKYLPNGFKKDSTGNYYYQIGNSETLFTTHLDTYSAEYQKVNHVIDDKDPFIIKTDGETILGGDNKLGCCILIGMIKNNIPGTYYFFLGEEPILSGGLWGSQMALESNPDFFKKFKRCIAFDRREYGSVVVRQKARMCCSPDFAKEIASNLTRLGDIKWDETGSFGYYTDTATFIDVIPECTNISAGGFKEHYKTEWVDLNYTYKVYQCALNIEYEKLPTIRKLEMRFGKEESTLKINPFGMFMDKKKQSQNLNDINKIFKLLGLSSTRDYTKSGTQHITFSKWLEDIDFDIYLSGSSIMVDEDGSKKKVTMSELKIIILRVFRDDIVEELNYYIELSNNGVDEGKKSINKILSIFSCKDIWYQFVNREKEI